MRDPLTVPVAEATIEELSAQAAHHGLNAALTTLHEFLQDSPHIEQIRHAIMAIGDRLHAPEVLDIGHTEGAYPGAPDEPLDLIQLYDLDEAGFIVFFPGHGSIRPGYGLLGRTSGFVRAYSVQEIHRIFGNEVIATMARTLNTLRTSTEVVQAVLRRRPS